MLHFLSSVLHSSFLVSTTSCLHSPFIFAVWLQLSFYIFPTLCFNTLLSLSCIPPFARPIMSTALPYLSLSTSLAGINLRKIALLSLLASYKITDTSAIALPESQLVAAAMNENEPSLDLISANSAVASPAKPVFAHFIVGNTYDYNVDDWLNGARLSFHASRTCVHQM